MYASLHKRRRFIRPYVRSLVRSVGCVSFVQMQSGGTQEMDGWLKYP
jgi:hypothetical protein